MSKKAVILLYPNPENDKYLERIKKLCAEKELSLVKVIEAEKLHELKSLIEIYDTAQEQNEVNSLIIDDQILTMPIFPLAWAVFGSIAWTKHINITFPQREEGKLGGNRVEFIDRVLMILNHYSESFGKKSIEQEASPDCTLEVINTEDERLVFNRVENLLKTFIIPADSCKKLIGDIKTGMILEQKPENEDYIHYLDEVEKASNDFQMDKIFSFLPVEDKYYIINSMFSRLQIRYGGVDYTMKAPFKPILRK